MQNNRFYKALIQKWLHNSYRCEKYLHLSCGLKAAFLQTNEDYDK